jgi:hypothetical protein
MLHLLNGDATAAAMPDAIDGDRAVWRDILMEGPPVADGAIRGAWLAPRLGVTADAYAVAWREGETILARARQHDEVVLWFEQDLFCAVNLWYVLDRLSDHPGRLSLVFPPLADSFDGLGRLDEAAFAPLFERRATLDAAGRDAARTLWQAYAAPDPTRLATLAASPLPFSRRAVRLHCGRFPSLTHGLDELEAALLDVLVAGGALDFARLFQTVTRRPALRELGIGDVQVAALLRDRSRGAQPLVNIDDDSAPFGRWRVSATPAAPETLAGHGDRLERSPIDRWIGGVHLEPHRVHWRWDASAERLVAPAA